ncbi:hypothetical protein AAG570_001389 [Ranatra chinensis]|uniref:Uncharacterized protein n=1 Tax=Ranatra chinensis TaxID=642074 RepID=A0ABD0YUA5_9HEMI
MRRVKRQETGTPFIGDPLFRNEPGGREGELRGLWSGFQGGPRSWIRRKDPQESFLPVKSSPYTHLTLAVLGAWSGGMGGEALKFKLSSSLGMNIFRMKRFNYQLEWYALRYRTTAMSPSAVRWNNGDARNIPPQSRQSVYWPKNNSGRDIYS